MLHKTPIWVLSETGIETRAAYTVDHSLLGGEIEVIV